MQDLNKWGGIALRVCGDFPDKVEFSDNRSGWCWVHAEIGVMKQAPTFFATPLHGHFTKLADRFPSNDLFGEQTGCKWKFPDTVLMKKLRLPVGIKSEHVVV